MEHVTEGLYLAASAGLFVLAVSLMLMSGRYVDALFVPLDHNDIRGNVSVIREVTADE